MYHIIYQGRKQGPLSNDQLKTFFSVAAISPLVTVTLVALLLGIILGTSCSPTTH